MLKHTLYHHSCCSRVRVIILVVHVIQMIKYVSFLSFDITFFLPIISIAYDQFGNTALNAAAAGGHTRNVKLLHDRGANIDVTNGVSQWMTDKRVITAFSQ
jgi:hypothetical protein